MKLSRARLGTLVLVGLALAPQRILGNVMMGGNGDYVRPTELHGNVILHAPDGSIKQLQPDAPFEPVQTLVAASGSNVTLWFPNQNYLTLKENTEMRFVRTFVAGFTSGGTPTLFSATPAPTEPTEPSTSSTLLELTTGQVSGQLMKLNLAKGSSFIIVTPAGNVSLTGGNFDLAVLPTAGDAAKTQVHLACTSSLVTSANMTLTVPPPATQPTAKPTIVTLTPGQELDATVETQYSPGTRTWHSLLYFLGFGPAPGPDDGVEKTVTLAPIQKLKAK